MANEVTVVVTATDKTGPAIDSATARQKKFTQSVGQTGEAYEQAGKKASGFSGTLRRVGEVAAGVLAAQALQAGAQRAYGLIQQSVKAASDLGESINAVNKVFDSASEKVQQWGRDNANSIGLSTRAFNQMATPLGSMLKNQGLNLDDVTQHTIKLTERAADMASVFNTDVSDALIAIQAGLRGEQDPLERYGVSLSAVAVEARALADSHKTSASQLTNQEKALARLNLIYDQTADTAGDFRDTADGLANSQRIATATIEDAKAKIGTAFIPVMTAAAQASGKLANVIAGMPPGLLTTTAVVGGLGAALLLLVPRVAATKAGLIEMGLAGEKANLSLMSVGRVAGAFGLAITALKLAESNDTLRSYGKALDDLAVKFHLISREAADSGSPFKYVWGSGGVVDKAFFDGKDYVKGLTHLVQEHGTKTQATATIVDASAAKMADAWAETFTKFDTLEGAHESALDKLAGKGKVTADSYIKELQRMVAEQEQWATNMTRLAGRVPEAMLDELRQLGPKGAAQVALLASMSDAQLQQVIALYMRSGAAAAQGFAAGITGQLSAIEAAAREARIAASRGMQQQRQSGGFAHGGIVGAGDQMLPAAASGGVRGGRVVVGEYGREVVDLPYGSTVHPNGTSEAMLGGGGGALTVSLEVVPGGSGEFERFMAKFITNYVRVNGGTGPASVQNAFGRRN